MIDWAAVFDESHPVDGASHELIDEFLASVVQPLSGQEINAIVEAQRNPFPATDPLHNRWTPIDPTNWSMPSGDLPQDYIDFLQWSNGGEFMTGSRRFQFLPATDQGHGVRATLLGYMVPEYLPGLLPFAFDGGGTLYLFDMREPLVDGNYPIAVSHAGDLGFPAITIAESFVAACKGTSALEPLFSP